MYYTEVANDVYEYVQYELTDKKRIAYAQQFLEQENDSTKIETVDQFWDWFEILTNEEIEDFGYFIKNNLK